jgi:hypothetical protein
MPDTGSRGGPVTVARFDWEMEASLAASRLAAAGIAAYIPDSVMGSLYWHYGKALGGIRLQVSAEDEEDARAILDERAAAGEEPIARGNDALAERAWRAARLGLIASFPLLPYAGWLLLRLLTSREPLGAPARRKAVLAAVVVLPSLAAMAAFAVMAL